MSEVENLSRYIRELANEGKFENIIINFNSNKESYDQNGIVQNQFLLKDLFDAYRKTEKIREGFEFIKYYEIDINSLEENYCLNSFGWLLYSKVKNESISGSLSNDSISYLKQTLPRLDLDNSYSVNLFTNLITKTIYAVKNSGDPDIQIIFKLFKSANILKNDEVKRVLAKDEFIIGGILGILKVSQRFSWAFSFLDMLSLKISESTQAPILNSYGWLLYAKLKAEFEDLESPPPEKADTLLIDYVDSYEPSTDSSSILKTLDLISESIEWYSRTDGYSPFSMLFKKYLKVQKAQNNTNWDSVIEFLTKFKVEDLSEECELMEYEKKGLKKQTELASNKEAWYAAYTHALFKTGEFEQCYKLGIAALEEIQKFHYNNDIWIARRVALSRKELGDVDTAINDLLGILKKTQKWFIQKEVADLYFIKDDLDSAMSFSIGAALSFGDVENKSGLFYLMGRILKAKGSLKVAFEHFLLSKLIRDEQGWSVPNELKIELSKTKDESILADFDNSKPLLKKLAKYWKGTKPVNQDRVKGWISNIRTDRGFGFIKGTNKKDYFFRLKEFKSEPSKLELNAKVSFKLQPSVDPDKNDQAVDIHLNNKSNPR